MQKENKEIIKLTAKEILLYLTDGIVRIEQMFDSYNYFRKSRNDYYKSRIIDKREFSKCLYRLKKSKFVKNIIKNNREYLELTTKGRKRIKIYQINDLKIKSSKTWDKKWRIVIFDVPNTKKIARDMLTTTLKRLGFLHLQKSVFVFPFPCKKEIDLLKDNYEIGRHVQYIIADRIDTEKNLLSHFYDQQILRKDNTK